MNYKEMSKLTCPLCSSNDTDSQWIDNATVGEYQQGECFKCGHEWNECAREFHNEHQEELF